MNKIEEGKRIAYYFCKTIVFLLVMLGLLCVNNICHEMKHFYDLKDDANITDICIMNIPENFPHDLLNKHVAYVRYLPHEGVETESSEAVAITFGLIPTILLSLIACAFLFNMTNPFYEKNPTEEEIKEIVQKIKKGEAEITEVKK